jgi:hypothetical protein
MPCIGGDMKSAGVYMRQMATKIRQHGHVMYFRPRGSPRL